MRIWLLLSISLLSVNAAPALERSSLIRRQNGRNNANNEVTIVTETETAVGTIVQTCTVRLTPVAANGGKGAVREDKTCKVEVRGNGRGGVGKNINNNNNNNNQRFASTRTETTTTTTTVRPTSTAVFVPPSPPPAAARPPPPPPAAVGGQVTAPPGIGVIGTGLPAAAAPTVAAPLPPANVANTLPAVQTGVGVIGQSTVPAAADQAGTPAAATAQESAAGFVIPGKKLQVLPIGLGVFAGISVIALIVVGLVTYERTKYRKTFRQRKLAESAAPMGYGGMAER